MSREMPDVQRLLRGVEYTVYQAKGYGGKPGAWHAHVSGLRRGDLDDLVLRTASVGAEGIAHQIERKVAMLVEETGRDERQAREDVLRSYAGRYRVTFNDVSSTGGTWTDVGFCSSEDEARERACLVIGWVLGRRLARATAGYVPRPEPVPAIRNGAFA